MLEVWGSRAAHNIQTTQYNVSILHTQIVILCAIFVLLFEGDSKRQRDI